MITLPWLCRMLTLRKFGNMKLHYFCNCFMSKFTSKYKVLKLVLPVSFNMTSRISKCCLCYSHHISIEWYSSRTLSYRRRKVTSTQLCTVNCRPMFRDGLVYLISGCIVEKLIGPSVNAAPSHHYTEVSGSRGLQVNL